MEQEKPRSKGVHYTVTDEQLKAYGELPVEERLRWLEEAREFMLDILSEERLETLQKFRRGEL